MDNSHGDITGIFSAGKNLTQELSEAQKLAEIVNFSRHAYFYNPTRPMNCEYTAISSILSLTPI